MQELPWEQLRRPPLRVQKAVMMSAVGEWQQSLGWIPVLLYCYHELMYLGYAVDLSQMAESGLREKKYFYQALRMTAVVDVAVFAAVFVDVDIAGFAVVIVAGEDVVAVAAF